MTDISNPAKAHQLAAVLHEISSLLLSYAAAVETVACEVDKGSTLKESS